MPLRNGTATCDQDRWIGVVRKLPAFPGRFETEASAPVGPKKPTVFKEAALAPTVRSAPSKGPLHSTRSVELVVAGETREIAGLTAGYLLQICEYLLGLLPVFEALEAAPFLSNRLKDFQVGPGLSRRGSNGSNTSDPSLRVDERTLLFTPACRRKNEVRQLGRLGRVIHILNDQEVEPTEGLLQKPLVHPGVGRIGADNPKTFDLTAQHALDYLIVRPALCLGQLRFIDTERSCDLAAVL